MLRERQCIPNDEHAIEKVDLMQITDPKALLPYLAPERSISFDGFVEYEAEDLEFHTLIQGRKPE